MGQKREKEEECVRELQECVTLSAKFHEYSDIE